MGFSAFCLNDGFVAAASSNIEIGGKGSAAMALFVLEHGQVHFYQGLQSCFWVCKLLEKTVPPWRDLSSNRGCSKALPFSLNCVDLCICIHSSSHF